MPCKANSNPATEAASGITRRALVSALTAGALATAIIGCAAKQTAGVDPQASPFSPPGLVSASTSANPLTPGPGTAVFDSASTAAANSGILQRLAGLRASQWGLDLPGILTRTRSSAIALTFDACGGPGGSGLDEELIATLRNLRVPATLFLNARWIQSNLSWSKELAADPLFEIANHGMAHVPLSTNGRSAYGIPGTTSLKAVLEEVSAGAEAAAALTGQSTPWFRTGTSFYDDVAVQAVAAMGLVPVNFSVNSDGGATFAPATVAAQISGARAGDIVIGHMNQPRSGTASGYATALPRLIAQGANFTTLSRAISPIPALGPEKPR